MSCSTGTFVEAAGLMGCTRIRIVAPTYMAAAAHPCSTFMNPDSVGRLAAPKRSVVQRGIRCGQGSGCVNRASVFAFQFLEVTAPFAQRIRTSPRCALLRTRSLGGCVSTAVCVRGPKRVSDIDDGIDPAFTLSRRLHLFLR